MPMKSMSSHVKVLEFVSWNVYNARTDSYSHLEPACLKVGLTIEMRTWPGVCKIRFSGFKLSRTL